MNIILEYSLHTNVPTFVIDNNPLLLTHAFMDDLNLLSSSVSGAKTLLNCCTKALKWASLDFWADKSRSIVIIKGRSMNTTPFSVSEPKNSADFSSYIPSIHFGPIIFLGRIIDSSISDRNSVDELEKKLITGLGIIDKSFFNGPQKLLILQGYSPESQVLALQLIVG